jgi:hypothetical protein
MKGFDVTYYDPAIARKAATPNSLTLCKLCTKPYIVRFYEGDVDLVCPECYETYKDCARIACIKCKEVVGRVAPKLLDCGFTIQPGSLLHTDKCGMCYTPPDSEQEWTSTVIEVDEWMKTHRRPKIHRIV